MKTVTDTNLDSCDALRRLDRILMSNSERRHARANLRDGELIAELLLRAGQEVGSFVAFVEHALAGLANCVRAMFAKPAKR